MVIFQFYLARIPTEKLLEDWVILTARGALVVPILDQSYLGIGGSTNAIALTTTRATAPLQRTVARIPPLITRLNRSSFTPLRMSNDPLKPHGTDVQEPEEEVAHLDVAVIGRAFRWSILALVLIAALAIGVIWYSRRKPAAGPA